MGATIEIHHLMYDELHKLFTMDLTKDVELLKLVEANSNEKIIVDEAFTKNARDAQRLFTELMDRRILKDKERLVEGWATILNAAKQLKQRGWYVHTATKYNSNLIDAWKATVNLNTYWVLNNDITIKNLTTRQTMNLDIFSVEGADYLLTTGGFWDLQENRMVGH